MPFDTITRRQLLATGLNATAALALAGHFSSAQALARETGNLVSLYDARFPLSRHLACTLLRAPRLQGVRGDASPLLARIASRAASRHLLSLQGVTTETVPFCLERFARSYGDVVFNSWRWDRDLFVWSLNLRAGPAAA